MAIVVSFMNNKGGVGKTTSTHSIGLAWAQMGKRVLFIDLDSQANLTSMLSVTDPMLQEWDRTIETAFIEGADPSFPGLPIIHTDTEGVDFVPADLELSGFERDTSRATLREFLLYDLLERVKGNYDFVLIDCPPAIQLLTSNAMVASDYIVLVSTLDGKSYKGVQMMISLYNEIIANKRFNPSLKIIGCLATRYQRSKINNYYWELFEKEFGPLLIHPYVRTSTFVDRATSSNRSIYALDPKGRAAEDYLKVAQDLLVRIDEDVRWKEREGGDA